MFSIAVSFSLVILYLKYADLLFSFCTSCAKDLNPHSAWFSYLGQSRRLEYILVLILSVNIQI